MHLRSQQMIQLKKVCSRCCQLSLQVQIMPLGLLTVTAHWARHVFVFVHFFADMCTEITFSIWHKSSASLSVPDVLKHAVEQH